jgi:glycosyltransferase involved in cell wall biosynthesis
MERPDILIFAPTHSGGLAEYSFYQGRALHRLGARLMCLAARDYLSSRACPFPIRDSLSVPSPAGKSKLFRRINHTMVLLKNQLQLAWWVVKLRPRLVLVDAFAEYLSPLWFWPHALLSLILGVRYAANLHDPVRDFQLGPAWWHKLSVRLAYQPLDFVLVHDKLPEPSPVPGRVRVYQVPHGLYEVPVPTRSRAAVRAGWGVTAQQQVFFSFGYVRDGKNLDLAIRALRKVPDAFLVIAGIPQSSQERPFKFYRELAAEQGVAGRVWFYEGFVPDSELGDYFNASDFVLLCYSAAFHSQSGVLNLAVSARKPVLASAAPSPLVEAVIRFKLGVVQPPDTEAGIIEGMRSLIRQQPEPRWDEYEAFAAWGENARIVLEATGVKRASHG